MSDIYKCKFSNSQGSIYLYKIYRTKLELKQFDILKK